MKRKLTGWAAMAFRARAFFALSVAALALFFVGSVALAAVINGTSSDDTLDGTEANDTIKGRGGNDTLNGRGGNDTLLGGVGNDTLDGALGTDTASYSASLTAVVASLATDSATGEGEDTFLGVENLIGSSKADTLTGSITNNKLTGGDDNDTLHSEGGNDTLNGGPGDDELRGADGVDVLNGGADDDSLYDKNGNTAERDKFNCDTGEDFVHADPTDQVLNNSCENVSFFGEDLLLEADWRMDETSGQMLDSSPNGNHATTTDVLQQTGSTYVFDGSTSHVLVPDADSLNPQANDITLRARVMVNGTSLDDDSYDVVRKGLVDTPGGDYKMEIIRVKADPTIGRLHCLFRGDPGTTVSKVASPDIVDGNWHTLECVKTANSVVARVDGKAYAKTGSAGSIANASNVIVGGKEVSPSPDDMFDGEMDFVSIDIAQPDIAP